MKTPRFEIDLARIAHNVRQMVKLYGAKGIQVIGITKGVCGDPKVARAYLENGIKILGDARIPNLIRLRKSGIQAPLLLVRLPSIREINAVVEHSDMSLNSELGVIEEISKVSLKKGVTHKIILMVEMGDLREGIMPSDLADTVENVLSLKGVKLIGIGTNFGCYGGIMPDEDKLNQFSDLAQSIEDTFDISLDFVSGGTTSCYRWIKTTEDPKKINGVRLGECLMLGTNELEGEDIPETKTDTMTLIAEVIESKVKPSMPYGQSGNDVFGNFKRFKDKGNIKRIILNVGHQDVFIDHLTPRLDIEILGASSDHMLVDANEMDLKLGDEVEFSVEYRAMLAAMTSSYVEKVYLNE